MKKTQFTCPGCHQPVESFYVPNDLILTDNPGDRVCRCPHCHADVDDQVQGMLDLIMREEELREWLWQERARLIRSIATFDDLEDFWKRYPPPDNE